MTTRLPPQCLACEHWISPFERDDADSQREQPTQICAAFHLADGGIPDAIWWNEADHREPHQGDHGIRWQSLGGADFPDWALAAK